MEGGEDRRTLVQMACEALEYKGRVESRQFGQNREDRGGSGSGEANVRIPGPAKIARNAENA
jgi:hypothetical protein